MKKKITLPLTTTATFQNPDDPNILAEISRVMIEKADNKQGYAIVYDWESWPDEPGAGTLTEEQITELAKEHGQHWEDEYACWVGDKVYILDSPDYPAIIQSIDADRHEYTWISYDEDGEEYDEGDFCEDDLGSIVFEDEEEFKDALDE